MTRALALACLLTCIAAVLGCESDGDSGSDDANGAGTPAVSGTTTANGEAPEEDGTPTAFENARDSFAARIQAMGPNIGAVPDDIRADLLLQCEALSEYADDGAVSDICGAVERAIDTGDFGLVDLILIDLDELEES
jgi:hypothetical protein